ncbi:MAG: hypothetical protein AAGI89_08200 [Pseudomonadota bacterium]
MLINLRSVSVLASLAALSFLSGCGGSSQPAITLDGWEDIQIGADASTIQHYIDENTRVYDVFGKCTNYQGLKDGPRALSVTVHNATRSIVEVEIGGVAKLNTVDGLGLRAKPAQVPYKLPLGHTVVTPESYTGNGVTRSNMGTVYLNWKSGPPSNQGYAQALRYEAYRESSSLRAISVGRYNAIGDRICD